MRRIIKWATFSVAGLIVLAAAGAGLGYAFLSATIPAERGSATIAGLGEPVRVVRDAEGIAHVEATSQLDAVAALGFVHAQDRLWQMEVLRMVGQGRLSELFGEPTIDTDIFLRTVDLAGASRASYDGLQPATRALLDAYADGVNAFINRKTRLLEPSLHPEFLILGHKPEPWEGWQSVLTLKVMALTLGGNMGQEIKRLALAARGLSAREIDDLVRYGPKDRPPRLPDLRPLYGFPPAGKTARGDADGERLETAYFDLAWPTGVTASNNWVISGQRTKSGKPLLANDPHLGLTAPALFYLAHLSYEHEGEALNLIGASLPSTPLILLGRNDRVAWGFTTSYLDSQDLFVERIHPQHDDQYLSADSWRQFDTRQVTINVKGRDPVTFTRRETVHGPVLPERYRGLGDILPSRHVAALQWIALAKDDTTMDAAIRLPHSRDVGEFMQALRGVVVPMQSIVVADVDGRTGFMAPARVPVRDPTNAVMGRAPVPGWLPEYDWKGWLTFGQLPRVENPPSGIWATANSNFLPAGYTHHITFDWGRHFRRERIGEVVEGMEGRHDVDTTIAAMADTRSNALVRMRDEALAQMPVGAAINPDLLAALRAWNGHMEANKPEPLVVMAWFKAMAKAMLEDDLGKDFRHFASGDITVVLGILETGGARDWCDNTKTAETESCGMIALESLQAAIGELETTYGRDWRDWRWGEAHMSYGEHRPFAAVGALARFFNVEVPSGGGPYTLRRGQTDFSEDHPYRSRHASVYRAVYDLSDMDNSLFIQATGQSGHFLSPLYRNFAERWAKVEFVRMTTRRQDYEADPVSIWKFSGE